MCNEAKKKIRVYLIVFFYFILNPDMAQPQTTQTAYLLSQGGLRSSKLTQHDMLRFLRQVFRVPSHGHLLNIIPIQGLSFTTFKEILQFKTLNITFMNLQSFFEDFVFRIQRILQYP